MRLYEGGEKDNTLLLYPSLHAWFTGSSKAITGNEFKIFGHVIHFLCLEISNNNVDLIAAGIMHPAKEHKFRKLRASQDSFCQWNRM